MSVSNVPSLFTKIHSGAEGGHEFARLCKKLLACCYHGRCSVLNLEDDSMGDFKKCDARLQLFEYGTSNKEVLLFQFKFYPSPLSAKHRSKIKTSFIDAANENPNVSKWILITPDDFNKVDSEWFDKLIEKSRNELIKSESSPLIEHWGHTRLINLLLEYKHIGIN